MMYCAIAAHILYICLDSSKSNGILDTLKHIYQTTTTSKSMTIRSTLKHTNCEWQVA